MELVNENKQPNFNNQYGDFSFLTENILLNDNDIDQLMSDIISLENDLNQAPPGPTVSFENAIDGQFSSTITNGIEYSESVAYCNNAPCPCALGHEAYVGQSDYSYSPKPSTSATPNSFERSFAFKSPNEALPEFIQNIFIDPLTGYIKPPEEDFIAQSLLSHAIDSNNNAAVQVSSQQDEKSRLHQLILEELKEDSDETAVAQPKCNTTVETCNITENGETLMPLCPFPLSILSKCDEMLRNYEKLRFKLWGLSLKELGYLDFDHNYNFYIFAISLSHYTIPQEIKYYKTLDGFKSFDEGTRYNLFKGAATEMSIVAGLKIADIAGRQWIFQDPYNNIKAIPFGKIYDCYGEGFVQTYCDILSLLPEVWRKDKKFVLILQALLLHWPKRCILSAKDQYQVERAFDFYLFLLTQYLKTKNVEDVSYALLEIQNFLQCIQHFRHRLQSVIKSGGLVTQLFLKYGSEALLEVNDLL